MPPVASHRQVRALALLVGLSAIAGCEVAFPLHDGYVGSAGDAGGASDGAGAGDSADAGGAADAGDAESSGRVTYEQMILADRPLLYLRLDDTTAAAKDSSGHGHDGTVGPGVGFGAKGLVLDDTDTAMSFPGTGDVGKISIPRSADLERASNLSVEVWVHFDGSPIPTLQRSFVQYGNDDAAGGASYKLLLDSTIGAKPGRLAFQIDVADTKAGTPYAIAESIPPAPSQTYHVVGTFDGTQLVVYVNGTAATTQMSNSSAISYPSADGLFVGGYAPTVQGTTVFGGILDEVAIYDHVLSASTVLAHYHAGAPPAP